MSKSSMQIKKDKLQNKKKRAVEIKEDLWSPENIAKNREALRRKSCPWEFKGMTRHEWYEQGRKKTYKPGCWEEEAA